MTSKPNKIHFEIKQLLQFTKKIVTLKTIWSDSKCDLKMYCGTQQWTMERGKIPAGTDL